MIPGAQFNRAPYSYTLRRAGGWFLESDGKTVQVPGFKFEVKVLYLSGRNETERQQHLHRPNDTRRPENGVRKGQNPPQNSTDLLLVVVVVKIQPGA
jgi:hypothetical protein